MLKASHVVLPVLLLAQFGSNHCSVRERATCAAVAEKALADW